MLAVGIGNQKLIHEETALFCMEISIRNSCMIVYFPNDFS